MDSGVVLPGESIEPDFDPCAGLDASEALWIMDEILCLEIAWLEGYPLSQTVYTSLHIDRLLAPDNAYPYTLDLGRATPSDLDARRQLTHKLLLPYCVATVKCCSMVLQIVQVQNYFEEEDFVTHLFGRELLPDLSTDEATTLLSGALEWLAKADLDGKSKAALEARIEFRRSFIQSIFGQADEWSNLVELIKTRIDSSRELCRPVPTAFTEKVQRQLATSTPPRPKLEIAWAEAKDKWIKLCDDVAEAPKLTSFWLRQSPACLQRAIWAFAARDPTTYPRAVLQDLIFADGNVAGDIPHFDLLLTDLRELVLAGDQLSDPECFQVEVVSDPRHKCSRLMETFMDGVLDEYLGLYRMVCQNRCRIRRTLTQAIVPLHILETSHAAKVDAEIRTIVSRKRLDTEVGKQVDLNPLTSWVRSLKLKTMAETIQLGFETDIYLPDEMCQMYWYLSSLISERRRLLNHIDVFTHHRLTSLSKTRDTRYMAECFAAVEWLAAFKADAEASISIADALWRLYALLLHVKIIIPPQRAFAEPQLLHDARMKPYLQVTDPSPPTLDEFLRARTLSQSVDMTCGAIEADIKSAKAQLGALRKMPPEAAKYVGTEDRWRSELKQLETTCVAISVSLSQLKRSLDKYGGDGGRHLSGLGERMEGSIPPPGKRYHDWWVVPQIKEKKR